MMKRNGIVLFDITFNITIFKENYIFCYYKYNSSSLFCHKTLAISCYIEGMVKKKYKKVDKVNKVIKASKNKKK